jgi:hypothetical protein
VEHGITPAARKRRGVFDGKSIQEESRINDKAVRIASKPEADPDCRITDHGKPIPQVLPDIPQHEVPPAFASLSHYRKGSKPSDHLYLRKDLFATYLKRAHGPTFSASIAEKSAINDAIEIAQTRCHVNLRELPTNTICPFCPDHPAFERWEDRLIHIGNHLEQRDVNLTAGIKDKALENWMIRQGFLENGERGWKLCCSKRREDQSYGGG